MAKRKAKPPETARQESATFQVGRDIKTGRFIPVKDAQRRKKTAVVETFNKR
jgi:hypothetical protein